MLTLRHPNRLREIDLRVPSSMTGPIVEMVPKPCSALESIRIVVKDATGPSIPVLDEFLGGSAPHLREIKLDGISLPFPEIRRVLSSSNFNLVQLHLSKIPHAVYFSPDDLVTALSTLVQLKRLTVGFHSPASSPPPSMTGRPRQRTTILPSLRYLYFHGTSEYLEEFVAQIRTPALYDINIHFFNQIFFDIPQVGKFIISHSNSLGYPTRVIIIHSAESVRISLILKGKEHGDGICVLETSCRRLDWQLSFVTQILTELSPFLSRVHSLTIQENGGNLPTAQEDVDSNQWLELFRQFTHASLLRILEKQLVPGIVRALVTVTEGMAAGLLPELTGLSLSGYHHSPSVAKAAEKFVVTRSRLSGRTIDLRG
jgi:hypothetical protein